MLDNAIARLGKDMEDKVPEYVRSGATTVLAELKTSEGSWKQIASGTLVESVCLDYAKSIAQKAILHQKTVDTMVDSALQIMAEEKGPEGQDR